MLIRSKNLRSQTSMSDMLIIGDGLYTPMPYKTLQTAFGIFYWSLTRHTKQDFRPTSSEASALPERSFSKFSREKIVIGGTYSSEVLEDVPVVTINYVDLTNRPLDVMTHTSM